VVFWVSYSVRGHPPMRQMRAHEWGTRLFGLDEAFGCAVLGVDEDDVFGVAAGGVDREEDDRGFEDARHGVDYVALEEEEVAGGEVGFGGSIDGPEGSFAGEDVEILVRAGVIVRRGFTVDAKDARAGSGLVGEIGVEQKAG